MTARALLLMLALGVAGCATLGRAGLPAPSPPPVRSVEVAVAPPPRMPAAPPPAPPGSQPELPPPPAAPPAPAAPVKPSSPVAIPSPPLAPPATPPASPVPIVPAPSPPPRVLAPQVSSEDEKRIQGEARRRIDRTERLVRQIDQRRLAEDQHQNLHTVQSFLAKAKEALTERDVQRALTLADKAYLLADQLARMLR